MAGSGLGLAISKRIAEALGGEILVESEPGVGSSFVLQLPYDVPAEAAPVATGVEEDSADGG